MLAARSEARRKSAPIVRRLRIIGVLVLVALLLSALTGEAVLRLTLYEEEANGNYWGIGAFEAFEPTGYRSRPGFSGRAFRRGVFEAPIQISEYGLRQSDLGQQINYERVLLIQGSSFTFGLGVEEDEAFPSLVRQALNPLGIGVINGSQSGFGFTQMVDFGIYMADIAEPRSMLLCLTFYVYLKQDYFRSYENIDVVHGYRLAADRLLARTPVDYLRTHSYLWMRLQKKWNGNAAKNRWIVDDRIPIEDLAAPGLDAVATLLRYCEERGIRLGIVLMASKRELKPTKREKEELQLYLWSRLHSIGVPVLDLATKGFDEGDFLDGDGHWSAGGHRRAAEHIIPFAIEVDGGRAATRPR